MNYNVKKMVVNKRAAKSTENVETLVKSESDVRELIKLSIHKANASTTLTFFNGGIIRLFLINIATKDLLIQYEGHVIDEND